MTYIPILGVFSNNISKYTFLFANGEYCVFDREARGVEFGFPRRIPGILGNASEAAKISGCVSVGVYVHIIRNDGYTYIGSNSVFDSLRQVRTREVFPGLAPYETRIRGIMPGRPNRSAFFSLPSSSFQVLLDDNNILTYDAGEQRVTSAPRGITDVYPGMEQLNTLRRIRACTRDLEDANILYFFQNDGHYIKYDNGRVNVPFPIANYWPGIYYLPSQSIFSYCELYRLTCEETTEAGQDEILVDFYVDDQRVMQEGPRDMNELDSFEEARDSHSLWLSRWDLNKRFYFRNNLRVRITEDDTWNDDHVGTLEVSSSDYKRTQEFFANGSNYKLSYKVVGLKSQAFDFSLLMIGFRFYHDVYVGVVNGGETISVVMDKLEAEFAAAAQEAQRNAEAFNREARESMESVLTDMGVAMGFELAFTGIPAVIGAAANAAIVTVPATAAGTAAGVGAAAGIAALKAAALTGGVALGVMAVTAAIALPIYFATVKFKVFILIANNLDLDLEVEQILVENGYQESGTFEGDIILRKNPSHISMANLSFSSFQNLRDGMSGQIHLRPKLKEGDRRIMRRGLIINFDIPRHSSNSATITYKDGNTNASRSLRSWSKVRIEAEGNTPTLLVNLSET